MGLKHPRARTRLFAVVVLAVPLASLVMLHGAPPASKRPYTTWSDYGGGPAGMQYSALTQISKSNVGRIELAWYYQVPGPTNRFGFNPVIVDNLMHVMGKEGRPTDRGIDYWESKDRTGRRLLFVADGFLRAIAVKAGVANRADANLRGRVTLLAGFLPAAGDGRPKGRHHQHRLSVSCQGSARQDTLCADEAGRGGADAQHVG